MKGEKREDAEAAVKEDCVLCSLESGLQHSVGYSHCGMVHPVTDNLSTGDTEVSRLKNR